ncbi:putative septum site-determining protein MinC [Chitiniphilus shinanonensis]|uniref:Probable septum site-determining protein MinC n=1 Tax=Chitiniphilus shinanonensis TaxID=553088 RepID=A0ABQ6BSA9_9NEIS|nr:septum site-determining protein MinC [Chitiniphilus shinanonensis]GLS04671.1 putative septum site-determining protein MinC [Chitiniphilus shinanonensis]
MPLHPSVDTPVAFEFKSLSLKLLSFVPATLDAARLETALREKLGEGEHMLSGEQLAIDFDSLPTLPSAMEISALMQLLRQFGLKPVAARGGNADQQAAAREAGLVVLSDEAAAVVPPSRQPEKPVPAMIVSRPVRTGQQVYARGGDLVVLALVSAGAEVIADGNIHVYAPLRGRALAGARGDVSARIFTTCLEAELVSIGGVYRTLDDALPASLKSKPAQVLLDQDKLVIEALAG